MDDPVKWAQVYLMTFDPVQKRVVPWTARWYQAEALRDMSKRQVLRQGRRTGKTEVMVVKSLYKTTRNRNFRVLFVTPYENQVRLIFRRITELINLSPLLSSKVVKMTSNPYQIVFDNDSAILGFTTGASSASGGASIRGQRADLVMMDEVDYMRDEDFDSVTAIAAERVDIEINMSSTPTGKRGRFYDACTNPDMGYTEHYHPSSHNPNWGPTMEAEFRAQLSEQGYIHEIEADFGIQEAGVFDKAMVDMAMEKELYAYTELDHLQRGRVQREGLMPKMHLYTKDNPAPYNPFRTMGIDLDKFSAGSSILVLEYDIMIQQFRVLKRHEVPRGEYSYDNAFNTILEFNEIYRPSWIYMDRGNTGEYMLERLHLHGKSFPETMLHNKVKGYQFKNTLDIEDPITREVTKQPMKPFMVTQLEIAFSRDKMILSPFDSLLHKQLIDYCVEKISASGSPVYTSVNEHFVDALGLAYLAFALEFPDIVNVIKRSTPQPAKIAATPMKLGERRYNNLWNGTQNMFTPVQQEYQNIKNSDDSPDRQKWIKVNDSYNHRGNSAGSGWGSRSGGFGKSGSRGGGGRSMW